MRTLLPAILLLTGCPRSLVDTREPPGEDPTDSGTETDPTDPTGPTDPTDPTDPTGTTTPPGGDAYAPVPAPPALSAAALADLEAEIDAIRASTVATTGVYAVDAENGQVVYAFDERVGKKPASNTKLFTTGVAFDRLGEDHRMEVTAWGDAAPSGAGVVDTLTVVGEHDFSWSSLLYGTDTFPAERLADRLWDAGVRSVGELVVAGEYLVEGYQFGYYDAATHRGLAEDVLFVALEGRGIAVGSTSTSTSFAAPAGAVRIASRGSMPLGAAAHPLNVYSHNEFADILCHHNGYVLGGASTYAEGDQAVEDWLVAAGIDTTGFELHDGSGLSHDNRVTPKQMVDLLDYLSGRPAGLAWTRTFSIGGVIGTLGSRMSDPDVNGRFFGKTGTLTGVIATSGVLHHRHDGHRYFVSALMNDVVDDTFARSLQDDIVTAVARDRRGLGDRPDRSTLRTAQSLADGRIELTWDAVSGADAYDLWFSRDGAVWDRADARRVSGTTSHVAAGLDPDTVFHVRLVATNAAGWSEPSAVLSARSAAEPSRILLVDGDDRYAAQAENPLGRGHDFLVAHARALGDRPFDSASHDAVRDGTVDLTAYDAVLWQLGEESSDDETFDDTEQDLVADALDAGVHLFVSGAELAWDLDYLGASSDRTFLNDTLGAVYAGDASETFTVEPVARGLFDGLDELGFYAPGTEEVFFADQLTPGPGAVAELRYRGGLGGTAAVSLDGAARVVVFGFPFETIETADARAQVMERILTFMGL